MDKTRRKNAQHAIENALTAGFGIETDIRDLDGTIVISHDPPKTSGGDMLTLDWLLSFYTERNCAGCLALNVKADGLSGDVKQLADQYGVTNYYCFDMSVPDMLLYFKDDVPVFTRASEYELTPSALDQSIGVWVDNFNGDYDQIDAARTLTKIGKSVAIVSPELHRRGDYEEFWTRFAEENWDDPSKIGICTDLPHEFEDVWKRTQAHD